MKDLEIVPAPVFDLDSFAGVIPDAVRSKLTIGLTSGGFDPLHPGHASCIFDAAKNCDILIVAVNGDQFLRNKKGRPFMPIDVRCNVIAHLKGVDYVVSFDGKDDKDQTSIKPLEVIKPCLFFKGGDRIDKNTIPEWETCDKLGIEIVTGMGDDKLFSSSDFLAEWRAAETSEDLKARADWFQKRQ